MTTERDSTMTLDELRDYFKRMEQVQESRRVCHNEFRAWHDAIDAHLSRKVIVSDEALQKACDAYADELKRQSGASEYFPDGMRAALESFAASLPVASVPDEMNPFDKQEEGLNYADGWNACRQSMLSAAPSDGEGEV